jgi:hypothetical protein
MTALRKLAIEFACLLRRSIRKLVEEYTVTVNCPIGHCVDHPRVLGRRLSQPSSQERDRRGVAMPRPLSQLFHRSRRIAGDRFRRRGTVSWRSFSAITKAWRKQAEIWKCLDKKLGGAKGVQNDARDRIYTLLLSVKRRRRPMGRTSAAPAWFPAWRRRSTSARRRLRRRERGSRCCSPSMRR